MLLFGVMVYGRPRFDYLVQFALKVQRNQIKIILQTEDGETCIVEFIYSSFYRNEYEHMVFKIIFQFVGQFILKEKLC